LLESCWLPLLSLPFCLQDPPEVLPFSPLVSFVSFVVSAGAIAIPTVLRNSRFISNNLFASDTLQLLLPVSAAHFLTRTSICCWSHVGCHRCRFVSVCRIRRRCLPFSPSVSFDSFGFSAGAVAIPTAIQNGRLICNLFFACGMLELLLPISKAHFLTRTSVCCWCRVCCHLHSLKPK